MPIIPKKVGNMELMDALWIALTKNVEERFLSPLIGNATITSGLIKTGLAIGSSYLLSGKAKLIVPTAFMVDGSEDVVTALLGSSSGSLISGTKSVELI